VSLQPFAPSTALVLQASTGAAGVALVNGTPAIISWTAPNDGNLHRFIFQGSRNVTVTEVGGALAVTYTTNGASGAQSLTIAAGSTAAPSNAALSNSGFGATIAPGTTVTVAQTSALTSGTCTVYAEIWGS